MIPTFIAYGASAALYVIVVLIGLHRERIAAQHRRATEELRVIVWECTWETMSFQRSVMEAMSAGFPDHVDMADYNRAWKMLTNQMAALETIKPRDLSQ